MHRGDLALNTIVIAVLALIVLVVIVVIFSNQTGKTQRQISGITACDSRGGSCVSASQTDSMRNQGKTCIKYLGCPGEGDAENDIFCCGELKY